MASTPPILSAVLAICVFACLLEVAGFVIPWWFVIGDGLYIGIWYFLWCPSGVAKTSNCTGLAFNSNQTLTGSATVMADKYKILDLGVYTATQVLDTVALGLLIFSTIGLIGSNFSKTRVSSCYGLIAFFLALSCLCLIPVIALSAYILASPLVNIDAYKLDAKSFPWSVVLTGCALLFNIIAFVTLAVALCRWQIIFDEVDEEFDKQRFQMSEIREKQSYDNYGHTRNGDGYQSRGSNHYAQPYNAYAGRSSYHDGGGYGSSQKYGPSMSNPTPYRPDNMYRGYQNRY